MVKTIKKRIILQSERPAVPPVQVSTPLYLSDVVDASPLLRLIALFILTDTSMSAKSHGEYVGSCYHAGT